MAIIFVLLCLAATIIVLRRQRRSKAAKHGGLKGVGDASAPRSHVQTSTSMPPPADPHGSSLGARESMGGNGSLRASSGKAEEVASSLLGSQRPSKEVTAINAVGGGHALHEEHLSLDGLLVDVDGRGEHAGTGARAADDAAALTHAPFREQSGTAHREPLPSQAASSMTATASEGAPSAGVRSSTGGVTTSFAAATTAYNTAAAASETAVEERKERLRTELDHMRRRGELFLDHYMVLPWTERREGGQGIVQFMRCTRTDKAVATKVLPLAERL